MMISLASAFHTLLLLLLLENATLAEVLARRQSVARVSATSEAAQAFTGSQSGSGAGRLKLFAWIHAVFRSSFSVQFFRFCERFGTVSLYTGAIALLPVAYSLGHPPVAAAPPLC